MFSCVCYNLYLLTSAVWVQFVTNCTTCFQIVLVKVQFGCSLLQTALYRFMFTKATPAQIAVVDKVLRMVKLTNGDAVAVPPIPASWQRADSAAALELRSVVCDAAGVRADGPQGSVAGCAKAVRDSEAGWAKPPD